MTRSRILFAFGLLAAIASPGHAADLAGPTVATPPPPATPSRWQFTFAPYIWTAGIGGDVGQFGLPPVSMSESIGDVLSSLDVGLMAVAEIRYDRFIVSTDLSYVRTSSSSDTPLGIFANSVETTSTSIRGVLLGGYELVDTGRFRLDAHAGLQVLSAETELAFSGGLLNGRTRSDSDTWADGLAGVRARFDFTPKFYMSGWAYAGAGQSDLVWDVMGGAGYNFNGRISSYLGYRANGVDYSSDGFVYDVVQQGPVAGLVFRF
ncbi:hypothetical protein [Roseibium aggregatum]|uniref:Outer membrane protein beta-barrel domain-containing protein n=1 Tax=Roseibium aggregatum TaxID=187304 RepID=A0A939EAW0_9HYPH|nr:hypothetical protein [Roseibium aggregatum]MBN9669827.1 hypothetical protein [Roseibium aggregatum]